MMESATSCLTMFLHVPKQSYCHTRMLAVQKSLALVKPKIGTATGPTDVKLPKDILELVAWATGLFPEAGSLSP